jgi:hypothetical protein
MVSVLCLCAQKNFVICQFSQPKKLNILCQCCVGFHNPAGELHGSLYYNSLVYYVGEGSIQGE